MFSLKLRELQRLKLPSLLRFAVSCSQVHREAIAADCNILRKLINKLNSAVIVTHGSLPIKTAYKYGANNLNLYPFSLVINYY